MADTVSSETELIFCRVLKAGALVEDGTMALGSVKRKLSSP